MSANQGPASSTSTSPSAQNFLDIYDVTNDILIMRDGSTALLISVSAMNFALLAEPEQDAIIYSYAGLLNSLNYPIQIVVRSQTKDVTKYLALLKEEEDQSDSEVKKNWIGRYREFVGDLIRERNVLDKKFYVVIPATSLEMGFMSAGTFLPGAQQADASSVERSVILEKAKEILEPKRDHLMAQFGRIGLQSAQLTTQEIIQLFYLSYNPEAAQGQQITDTNSYTTPLVEASMQGGIMDNYTNQPNQPGAAQGQQLSQDQNQGATPAPNPEPAPTPTQAPTPTPEPTPAPGAPQGQPAVGQPAPGAALDQAAPAPTNPATPTPPTPTQPGADQMPGNPPMPGQTPTAQPTLGQPTPDQPTPGQPEPTSTANPNPTPPIGQPGATPTPDQTGSTPTPTPTPTPPTTPAPTPANPTQVPGNPPTPGASPSAGPTTPPAEPEVEDAQEAINSTLKELGGEVADVSSAGPIAGGDQSKVNNAVPTDQPVKVEPSDKPSQPTPGANPMAGAPTPPTTPPTPGMAANPGHQGDADTAKPTNPAGPDADQTKNQPSELPEI